MNKAVRLIAMIACTSSIVGCSYLVGEEHSVFRDRSKDYEYSESGKQLVVPETYHLASIEPHFSIPGEKDYRPVKINPKQSPLAVDESPFSQMATQTAKDQAVVIEQDFFRVWHLVSLKLKQSGYQVLEVDEENGIYLVEKQADTKQHKKSIMSGFAFWQKEVKSQSKQYQIVVDKISEFKTGIAVFDQNGEVLLPSERQQVMDDLNNVTS